MGKREDRKINILAGERGRSWACKFIRILSQLANTIGWALEGEGEVEHVVREKGKKGEAYSQQRRFLLLDVLD